MKIRNNTPAPLFGNNKYLKKQKYTQRKDFHDRY